MTSNPSRESSEFEFVTDKDGSKAPSRSPSTTVESSAAADGSGEQGLFGWVKGSGDLFSKVAAKTKSSVESVIMVLDPQMKDYIHSSGTFRVIVASDNHAKVTAIKNAFHREFGLATVYGVASQPKNVAAQPVGFAAARQSANERIQIVRNDHPEAREPGTVLIAIDNFLLEVGDEDWVDQGCLLLSDKTREINLCAYTQPTNVPFDVIQKLQNKTDESYPLSWSGFSTTVGSYMSEKLNVAPSAWHEAACGVTREDLLTLAARSLAHSYRLSIKAKVDQV